MQELTPRQQEALNIIKKFIDSDGSAPTKKELGVELGNISTTSVNYYLVTLQRKGFISLIGRKARGIKVLKK